MPGYLSFISSKVKVESCPLPPTPAIPKLMIACGKGNWASIKDTVNSGLCQVMES